MSETWTEPNEKAIDKAENNNHALKRKSSSTQRIKGTMKLTTDKSLLFVDLKSA